VPEHLVAEIIDGLAFAPTTVGVLIDIDLGAKDDFLAACGSRSTRRSSSGS
jgi:hypothetical protein